MSPTLGHQEFYSIRHPYSDGRCVVYGDGDMGWYEYVLIDSAGRIVARSNAQYGSAEIALLDALIAAAGVEGLVERMRQAPSRLWRADLIGQQISVERMRDILAFALAANRQEGE